ncbi:hypothetical protein HDU77_005388 [Chytriomyces hyalinus]|nr:hypothetical protein HDU77_005388 [Chytriomyces hyalinus]
MFVNSLLAAAFFTVAVNAGPALSVDDAQLATQALSFLIQAPGECLFQYTDLPANAPSHNMAALWLRAIFHDSGTFNASDLTGGLDASLVTNPESLTTDNIGIPESAATRFIPSKSPISKADMIALGGIVTVAACGGPQVAFRTGRDDAAVSNNAKLLPSDAFAPVGTIKAGFLRMGLTALDMLVLTTGSHSMGGAHAAISPNVTKEKFEPFDRTPGVFDNDIFKRVLDGKCVVPIDCAFAKDPELLPYIQQYAKDENAFFTQYAISFEKMLNLSPSSLSDPVAIMIKRHSNLVEEGTWPPASAASTTTTVAAVASITTAGSAAKSSSAATDIFLLSSVIYALATTLLLL